MADKSLSIRSRVFEDRFIPILHPTPVLAIASFPLLSFSPCICRNWVVSVLVLIGVSYSC